MYLKKKQIPICNMQSNIDAGRGKIGKKYECIIEA